MKSIQTLVMLSFLVACSPTPSRDGGTSEDAGETLDAGETIDAGQTTDAGGQCVVPPPKNDLLLFLGERADVPIGDTGCDPAQLSVSVTDATGTSVAAELINVCTGACEVRARFTPLVAGVHSIVLSNSAGPFARRGALAIESQPLGFSATTFLDRMDDCGPGPFRTSNGVVLCGRQATVAAYAPDGGRIELFFGGALAVLGTDVWTIEQTSRFQHRTAIDEGTLRDDGVAQSPEIGGVFDNTVRLGSIINATRSLDGWVEATFDGGVLSATVTATTFPQFFGTGPRSFVPEPGVGAFTSNLCVASPGCQPPLTCQPVLRCPPANNLFINSIGEHAVFSVFSPNSLGDNSMTLGAIPRPLEPGLTTSSFVLDMPDPPNVPIANPGLESPAFQVGSHVVFAELIDRKVKLRAFVFPGQLQSVTDDWIISTDPSNPMKIFYAPSPIRYR
ncbi:MAG: hypothetical protein QM817_17565 [Archangium sp.]